MEKHSSLQSEKTKKKFYIADTWAKCYKTFFVCNLLIFEISSSVC